MARKNATPYPAQVRSYLAELTRDGKGIRNKPFSAATLYGELEHGQRQALASAVGSINKALHKHWAAGELIAFCNADGELVREESFVAPGSKAVEHPQVFALPGARPPRGCKAVTYQGFYSRGSETSAQPDKRPARVSTKPAESSSQPEAPPALDGEIEGADASAAEDLPELPSQPSREEIDAAAALVGALQGEDLGALSFSELAEDDPRRKAIESPLALFALIRRGPDGVAPEWLPDEILREYVTKPSPLAFLREGLNSGSKAQRLALITTQLPRKGQVDPDSLAAGALANLCRRDPFFWGRCASYALDDYNAAKETPQVSDLPRLFGEVPALAAEYNPAAVVLCALCLGLASEDVQLVALEALDERERLEVDALDEHLHHLQGQLAQAQAEAREHESNAREQAQARAQAENRLEALKKQRDSERAKAGGEAAQVSELRAELDRSAEAQATLTTELDGLADEVERLRAGEVDLAETHARLTANESELARERAHALEQGKLSVRLERELGQALRAIGDLTAQVTRLQARPSAAAAPEDARSLVALLDSAIGSLLAETSERMRDGTAGRDDQQLLAFAAHFVEFKNALPTAPPPAGPVETLESEAPADPSPGDDTSVETVRDEDVEVLEDQPEAAEPTVRERRRRAKTGWTVSPRGGAGEVGGTAIVVTSPSGRNVLLDAGQRVRGVYGDADSFHYALPGFDRVDAILVSHAHIDHCGSLPVLHRSLVVQQQQGAVPVFMSEPTVRLAEVMMNDSAKIQHHNERNAKELAESDFTIDMVTQKPAYDHEEVKRVIEETSHAVPGAPFEIPGSGIVARFDPVAHVLGSCAIHLTDTDSGATLLYTGDVGPFTDSQLTLPDFGGFTGLQPADVVIIESTYGKPREIDAGGGGRKPRETLRQREVRRFYDISAEAFARDGHVLVPCFSLGRAQEIVRLIGEAESRDLAKRQIYAGGMAERILEIYVDSAEQADRGQGIRWVTPGAFPRTTSLKGWLEPGATWEEVAHEILSEHDPGFVIASPATMTAGWSRTFADLMIGEERHAVVFSGFLPRDDRLGGDPLTRLRKGAMYPFDRDRRIECDWQHVGLSAHAPAEDLRALGRSLAERASGPVTFACVHGSQAAQQALADDLGALGNASAHSLINSQSLQTSR